VCDYLFIYERNRSKTVVMVVIRFLLASLGSSRVLVADAHANIQRLVSVIKMATMPEGCTTEEQHSVVRFFFCGQRAQCNGYS
jgi:hypothetical protein